MSHDERRLVRAVSVVTRARRIIWAWFEDGLPMLLVLVGADGEVGFSGRFYKEALGW